MKPPTHSPDGKKLTWLIELLNEGRRPEPSVAESRKPADKKKLKRKEIDLWKARTSPDGLRAQAGGLVASIVNLLINYPGPFDQIYSSEEEEARRKKAREGLRTANEIAKPCLSYPRFAVDGSGKLRIERVTPPQAYVIAPLLGDALEVLTYLIERGLHVRLKSCLGYRAPHYRGEPARRCRLWFNGAENKHYCSMACRKRAERIRNVETYRTNQRKLMRKLRAKKKEEEAEFYAKEKTSKWKRPRAALRSSRKKVEAR